MTKALSPLAARARLAAFACLGVLAAGQAQAGGPPPDYAPLIARYARQHGVPERLVHRVIMRESRYNPRVVAKGNFGLMQIKLATARGMGYSGGAQGLLDPDVNMRHAVPYLANAYIVARGNEDMAVRYYAGGYYYAAKRQGLLARMRTAHSGAARPDPAPKLSQEQAGSTPLRAAYASAEPKPAALAALPEETEAAPAPPSVARRNAVAAPAHETVVERARSAPRRAGTVPRRAERVAMRRAAGAAPTPEPRPAEAETQAPDAPAAVEQMRDTVRD